MTIPRKTAKELCTQAEYALVNASFPPQVKDIPPARIGAKAERARKLQDKYRQLARKQHRALKGEPITGGAANLNAKTEKKAQLFEETRVRFEKRMKELKG